MSAPPPSPAPTPPAATPTPEPQLLDRGYPFDAGEFDWVFNAGIENMKGRREVANTLAQEAAAMLTVLLAGIGGALAYAFKLLEADFSNSVVAAAGACLWLMYLAGRLIQGCMRIMAIPAVYNQPGQLLLRVPMHESFGEWKYGELLNLEERIRRATQRNNSIARRINVLRLAAVATPAIAVMTPVLFALGST